MRLQPEVRISQCMIVKNEEKNIEKALSWGKEILWEQIVVDTGSTDKTVEIAKQMGAKVFFFPWKDDFAAAKNYALQQASGNWIAFLDADETFSKKDAEQLKKLLEKIHKNKEIDFVRCKMLHVKNSESKENIAASCQDRIFRNTPQMQYRYRIHEQLYHKIKEIPRGYDAQEELVIIHTGYGVEVNREEKGKRNARLLEKELQENPKDGTLLTYLGDAYDMAGKTEEALNCYRKVLWDLEITGKEGLAGIHAGLQILRIRSNEPTEDTKKEYFKVAERLKALGWERHPDIDYYMGFWYAKTENLEKSAELFEQALEKMEVYNGDEIVQMTCNLEFPNYIVAGASLNRKELPKAVKYAVAALRINKYSPDAVKVLLAAFCMESKKGVDAAEYWDFLCKIYDGENLKDLLFLYKFTQESGFESLEELIWKELPEEVRRCL